MALELPGNSHCILCIFLVALFFVLLHLSSLESSQKNVSSDKVLVPQLSNLFSDVRKSNALQPKD